MIKHKLILVMMMLLLVSVSGCAASSSGSSSSTAQDKGNVSMIKVYNAATPPLSGGNEATTRKVVKPLTLEQLRVKYKSNIAFEGPSYPKRAALTFDDVPDRNFTAQVLDVLKEYHVPATFFVVGNRAEKNPDMIQRLVNEGHVLGNHSYSHRNLPKESDAVFHEEVLKTQQAVERITGGYRMQYIRTPYGNINEEQLKWLVSQKLKVVNWNVDSLDWKGLNADQVEANIISHVKPGSIILQHGAGGVGEDLSGTVQALPRIIKQLQDQGYELVTVPVLLGDEQK
ncbi:polysaccharide deacetylase family protein [Paenibacillus marinisediminis]